MQGSVARKLGRVVLSCAKNPKYVRKYVASQRRSPLSLGLPWISYGAIDFLENFLRPDMEVFEYGSGGSTVFFADRVKSVTSVEEDTNWIGAVKSELRRKKLENADILESNWEHSFGATGFESSDYIQLLSGSYDLILIDGQCYWPQNSLRIPCFYHAITHLKPGGVILLDDSWRYDDALSTSGYSHRHIYKSIGPCRPGVTTTTAYYFE